MTDLDEAADELYALSPAELDSFGSRRAALVAAARADGDRELARQIGALKKPVLAAALANALVRARPAELVELAKLARQLRSAHRNLRGKQLRELSEQRQRLLGRLVELSRGLAGREVGESVLNQLRATFEAAIADERAQSAVRSGRLTGALSYSGFGEVDLSDAVANPRRLTLVPELPDSDTDPESKPADDAEDAGTATDTHTDTDTDRPDPAAVRAAERELKRAESALAAAEEAAGEAADRLAEATATEQQLADRARELQAELAKVRADAAAAAKASAAAERDQDRTGRARERAERGRRQAEAALRALAEDQDSDD